jgi:hypothetical protein
MLGVRLCSLAIGPQETDHALEGDVGVVGLGLYEQYV